MCGRFEFMLEAEDIAEYYQLDIEDLDQYNLFQNMEVFPSQAALVVLPQKQVQVLKWGLDESWTKKSIINTRLETADLKKTSQEAFQQRRCIIPVSAFFEWGPDKQKYAINLEHSKITSLAGIYNYYVNEAGESYAAFSILTQASQGKMAEIHQRVPVILPHGFNARYLDHRSQITALKKSLLSFNQALEFQAV